VSGHRSLKAAVLPPGKVSRDVHARAIVVRHNRLGSGADSNELNLKRSRRCCRSGLHPSMMRKCVTRWTPRKPGRGTL